MKKENKIIILGKPYKIIYVDKPSDVDVQGVQSLLGQVDFWTKTIRIFDDNTKSEEDLFEVLIHEIIHALINDLHIYALIDKDGSHKEDSVDLLSTGLADTLIRNNLVNIEKIDIESFIKEDIKENLQKKIEEGVKKGHFNTGTEIKPPKDIITKGENS